MNKIIYKSVKLQEYKMNLLMSVKINLMMKSHKNVLFYLYVKQIHNTIFKKTDYLKPC